MERYRRVGQELYAALYKDHVQVKDRNIGQQLSVVERLLLDYPEKMSILEVRWILCLKNCWGLSQQSSLDITSEVWYSITQQTPQFIFSSLFSLCLNELFHSSNCRHESKNFDFSFYFFFSFVVSKTFKIDLKLIDSKTSQACFCFRFGHQRPTNFASLKFSPLLSFKLIC